MKKILSLVALLTAIIISAQSRFEKGYIIMTNNERKEVLIKNLDWINNVENFSYKVDEQSSESIGTINDIKEFGVYGYSKYIAYKGPIEYSPEKLSDLSNTYEPEFKQANVFLKILVSGDKNLYAYTAQNTNKYFYSDISSDIKPLVYKKYNPEGNTLLVATNDTYLNQLKNIFKDDSDVESLVTQTKYTATSLTKIFQLHNEKSPTLSTKELQATKVNPKFNLSIRPGINLYSPLEMQGSPANEGFESKSGLRIGIEAELVLPFNKNKWSIIFEPTYSFYSSKKMTIPSNDKLYNISMDGYSFINLPIGVRHYMYLNNKSKIFINAQVNALTFKSGKAKSFDLDYNNYIYDNIKLSSTQSFNSCSFGIGYTYNNKYSIEIKYNTNNNIVDNSEVQTADIKYVSIIFGYNIF